MSRTTSTESLPPATLYPSDLRDIEAELDERSAEVSISIVSQASQITSTYESVDDLLADPLVPEHVTDYQLWFETDEGEGVIYANSTDSDKHEIRLYGDFAWKNEIYTVINSIISSNVNSWRNRFQEYELRIANLFSTILAGFFFLQIIPTGPFYPADHRIPILSILFALFLAGAIATGNRHEAFPYVTIYTVDEKEVDQRKNAWWNIIYLVIFAWLFMWVLRFLWPFLPI
ncbi:hypothetical protein [Halanaeroarchaeum sulfurireducens]|uniref:Uncharacterized protein n=1 Tax=Halanaeroarchaeum sulfurireducens TaxID=1604004 RepID=A0A0F7PD99_9EURY|nr:hypothetical protein [Halanaeroarchaeum sulfurireducens]AKH98662.1 hypothetical protein HLASF_3036 [Halanaeroarchaeum sulfurireducens]ALG83105.1 hypothetical protein HLASA_3037 [Halanaeroarchaeum sulfurireducens]